MLEESVCQLVPLYLSFRRILHNKRTPKELQHVHHQSISQTNVPVLPIGGFDPTQPPRAMKLDLASPVCLDLHTDVSFFSNDWIHANLRSHCTLNTATLCRIPRVGHGHTGENAIRSPSSFSSLTIHVWCCIPRKISKYKARLTVPLQKRHRFLRYFSEQRRLMISSFILSAISSRNTALLPRARQFPLLAEMLYASRFVCLYGSFAGGRKTRIRRNDAMVSLISSMRYAISVIMKGSGFASDESAPPCVSVVFQFESLLDCHEAKADNGVLLTIRISMEISACASSAVLRPCTGITPCTSSSLP